MSVIIKETRNIKTPGSISHAQIPLSNSDLIAPEYVKLLYFFKNVDRKVNFMDVQRVQNSLRDILTDYYPLTGAVVKGEADRLFIDCEDRGILFVIAEGQNITIEKLEENDWGDVEILKSLINIPVLDATTNFPLLTVQHTTLVPDGSVVIGISLYHFVADGDAIFRFLENWGRKARHERIVIPPIHDRNLYRKNDDGNKQSGNKQEVVKQNDDKQSCYDKQTNNEPVPPLSISPTTLKIFKFSNDQLKRLHDAYSDGIPEDKWISTNDALVAHFWRIITRARCVDLNAEVICTVSLNVREKLVPPLPKGYFGNAHFITCAKLPVSKLIDGPRSEVALQIRKVITEVDDARIRSWDDWMEHQSNKHQFPFSDQYVHGRDIMSSSWTKFPIYGLDLGDGKPTVFRYPGISWEGALVIVGTPDDTGFEIFVCLKTEQMEKLELDLEFNEFLGNRKA